MADRSVPAAGSQPIDQRTDPSASAASHEVLRAALARVASGPRHAKALTREQACDALGAVLAGADAVEAAILLIALRMKRETDAEFLGVLDAIRAETRTAVADVPAVVDLSDPYDGFSRGPPVSPWLGPVLAACGVPSVVHGLETVGPKHGLTARQVLAAAGAPVDLTPAQAAGAIERPGIGWAYVDQSRYAPRLHALAPLRERMLKRTVLNTVERVLGPVRGARRTGLVIGYVHAPYAGVYSQLALGSGFTSALLVKGAEGGLVPASSKPVTVQQASVDGAATQARIDPAMLDLGAGKLSAPSGPPAAARQGIGALEGSAGAMRDALVYGASLCLWGVGAAGSLERAAARVLGVLASGAAYERFLALGANYDSPQ